jgi:transposase
MVLAGEKGGSPVRGDSEEQGWMLLAITPDQKVPRDHPIRALKPIVDRALLSLSPVFNRMYSKLGRPSIPPEHLLKASLLIALYSIRSERQFCERLEYDLLFKWFLDQNIGTPAFDASTFSKNRQRLMEHDVARQFFEAVLGEAKQRDLLSDEHFAVDGTLLEAWASMKSVRPKDGGAPPSGGGRNPDVDYRGERRSNETHASTTDPEARLMRKGLGKETKLCFAGHVLMENRNGLVVDVELTQATGRAEREAAVQMLDRLPRKKRRITLGADKGYDVREFVAELRERNVTPHVAQNQNGRRSAIDGRTTRHGGYKVSQRVRKRVEEIFGWEKTVGGGDKLRYFGVARNKFWAVLTAAGYNLVRMVRIERRQAIPAA